MSHEDIDYYITCKDLDIIKAIAKTDDAEWHLDFDDIDKPTKKILIKEICERILKLENNAKKSET